MPVLSLATTNKILSLLFYAYFSSFFLLLYNIKKNRQMQRKIIHVKKSSVALKRELILHPIYEGFCYPWRTKGQKGPLEN